MRHTPGMPHFFVTHYAHYQLSSIETMISHPVNINKTIAENRKKKYRINTLDFVVGEFVGLGIVIQ